MTFEKEKYLLRLDLQNHADGDDDDYSIVGDPASEGEQELANAIRSLLDSDSSEEEEIDEFTDETDELDDEEHDDETDEFADEEDDDLDTDDEVDDDEPEVGKKQQSKEDNARFAKERREREARERAEAELERLKQESPEFQLAQMLSETYGQPVEVIMEQIKEEQLKRQAQEQNVPVEVLRKQRDADERANRLEQEIANLKFQGWQNKIKADGELLQKEYTMLTQEDLDGAVDYILQVAKNVDMPLEDAVFALHGKKIAQALAKGKIQEDLASQSGRKRKTPPSIGGGKPPRATSLSSEEKAMAKVFGMTEAEYEKFKS